MCYLIGHMFEYPVSCFLNVDIISLLSDISSHKEIGNWWQYCLSPSLNHHVSKLLQLYILVLWQDYQVYINPFKGLPLRLKYIRIYQVSLLYIRPYDINCYTPYYNRFTIPEYYCISYYSLFNINTISHYIGSLVIIKGNHFIYNILVGYTFIDSELCFMHMRVWLLTIR